MKDLLNPKNADIKIRESPQKGVWVDGLTEEVCLILLPYFSLYFICIYFIHVYICIIIYFYNFYYNIIISLRIN